MAMTDVETRYAATRFLAAHVRPNLRHEVAIVDQLVRQFDDYWCFPYDGKRYVEVGDPVDMMAGNVPILVEKESGAARFAHEAEYAYLYE